MIYLENVEYFCNTYDEIQPNSSDIIIKVNCAKNELYHEFIKTLDENDEEVPSLKLFLHIWRVEYYNLKLRSLPSSSLTNA